MLAEPLYALVVIALESRKERDSEPVDFRHGLPTICADTLNARTFADSGVSTSWEQGTRTGLPKHPGSGLRPVLVPTP